MNVLDLFCGAGGASDGYSAAGHGLVGVDIDRQRRYPFRFHQSDALTYPLDWAEFVHASPPCQRFSKSVSKANRERHPDLIDATRQRLLAWGGPFVLENVPGAPIRHDLLLCGSMFGLQVRRHRWFELHGISVPQPACRHDLYEPRYAPAWNRTTPLRFLPISGGWTAEVSIEERRAAMGIDWAMTPHELSEAIPPAYTYHVGVRLGR